MEDVAWKDSVTTIQVSKETRDFLRKLTVHAGTHCYEDLFVKHILPLIKKDAGSGDPVKIGKRLACNVNNRAKRVVKRPPPVPKGAVDVPPPLPA